MGEMGAGLGAFGDLAPTEGRGPRAEGCPKVWGEGFGGPGPLERFPAPRPLAASPTASACPGLGSAPRHSGSHSPRVPPTLFPQTGSS